MRTRFAYLLIVAFLFGTCSSSDPPTSSRPPSGPGDNSNPADGSRSGDLPDGRARAYLVVDETAESLPLGPAQLPPAAPPLQLTGPTSRHGHGVLGDGIEAAGITLVETVGSPAVAQRNAIPAPAVNGGLAPIWADWTGDGERDIIRAT